MKNFILIIAISLLVTACAIKVPLTRTEFISAVQQGKGPMVYKTATVNKGLKSLVNHLHNKSNECLNKAVQRSMSGGGYAEASSTRYNPKIEYTSRNKAEFTLQVQHSPRGSARQPAEGLYVVAIDMTALNTKQTRLDVYKPTFAYTHIGNEIHQWAMGKDSACPELK